MHRELRTPHELLDSVGAVFVRKNKHEIWKLPNGRTVTLSTTPSCPFVLKKQISDIKREMKYGLQSV